MPYDFELSRQGFAHEGQKRLKFTGRGRIEPQGDGFRVTGQLTRGSTAMAVALPVGIVVGIAAAVGLIYLCGTWWFDHGRLLFILFAGIIVGIGAIPFSIINSAMLKRLKNISVDTVAPRGQIGVRLVSGDLHLVVINAPGLRGDFVAKPLDSEAAELLRELKLT
jgi:hypothetical protein